MSWQAYIDSSLVGTKHVHKACITSIAGDSIWAKSADFEITPDEVKNIATIMGESEKESSPVIDNARAEGIHVAGVRYVLTKVEGRSAYARQGKAGICIVKSKQALIIAWHNEDGVAGNASSVTEGLADYLIGQGY